MNISSLIDQNISSINENWYNLTKKIFNESPFKKGIYLINEEPVDRSFIVDDYDPITGENLGKTSINLNKNATFKLTYLEFVTSNEEYYTKSNDYFDMIKELIPGYPEKEEIKFEDITSLADSLIRELYKIGEKLKDKTFENFYDSVLFEVSNRWNKVSNPNLLQFQETYIQLFNNKIQEAFELKIDIAKFQISENKLQFNLLKENLAALLAIIAEAKIFENDDALLDFASRYFWVQEQYSKKQIPLVRKEFIKSFKKQGDRNIKDASLHKIIDRLNAAYQSLIDNKARFIK